MIMPSALNLAIVGAMMVIWFFIWRFAAGWLVTQNPDSQLGKAMGSIIS